MRVHLRERLREWCLHKARMRAKLQLVLKVNVTTCYLQLVSLCGCWCVLSFQDLFVAVPTATSAAAVTEVGCPP